MKKTGIFYGSATGTTADVAQRIASRLDIADADIHNVADTAPDKLGNYDVLILGSSTWGLKLSISGNGRQMWLPARIAGFSSRLNTIAVPQQFMDWANAEFADRPATAPSRIIVETNSPGDPRIEEFLADHRYEVAGDKVDNGRAAYFLAVVTAIVVAVGIVISLLAFFILLLSIYLLLQKNREKIRQLMMLGYAPEAVARYYNLIVLSINAGVLVGAIVLMLVAKLFWTSPLSSIGVASAGPWIAIVIGVVIMAAITAGNLTAISRSIRRAFPRP